MGFGWSRNQWAAWSKPFYLEDEEALDDFPLLSHDIVWRLNTLSQLGPIVENLRFARHSRLMHVIEALDNGASMCRRLYEKKMITEQDFIDVMTFIALHDIGHLPYSHGPEKVIEDFTGEDHKQRGIRFLDHPKKRGGKTIGQLVTDLGASMDRVKAMMRGVDPLGAICSHRVFGADKLAYLTMDAQMLGFDSHPPDVRRLPEYLVFRNDILGVEVSGDTNFLDRVGFTKALQQFYTRMYGEVYFGAYNLIRQRHLERATEFGIRAKIISPESIEHANDAQFLEQFYRSDRRDPLALAAKSEVSLFQNFSPYVPAIALKLEGYTRPKERGEYIEQISAEQANDFSTRFDRPKDVTLLEETVSQEMRVPCIITTMPSTKKLKIPDVTLFDEGDMLSMRAHFGPHYAELADQQKRYFAVRVCVPPEYQQHVASRGSAIAKAVLEFASYDSGTVKRLNAT